MKSQKQVQTLEQVAKLYRESTQLCINKQKEDAVWPLLSTAPMTIREIYYPVKWKV